jgi:two-component system sensor histidine kinase TctE
MLPKSQSLRRQLLSWLLTLLIPLLLIGAVASSFWAYHFSNLAYDRSLFRAALALADQVLVVNGKVVVDLPQKALDLLEYDKEDWIYYRVVDPNGNTITGQITLPLPQHLPRPGEHRYYDALLGDQPVRVVAFSLPLKGTSVQGAALVQVAETKSKRDQLADEIIAAMLLPQVLIVLLAGALVHFGVRRGLASLHHLQRAIEQRSHRDLSPVPLEKAPQEVLPLLRSMNDLLQRVRQSIAHQQRFTADASHQLRTPLAGIQTQAEVALREHDPARIRRALEWIQAGTANLSHLVSQLLALSRVDPASGREVEMQELDLKNLARETTAEWVAAALERQIDLGFESPDAPVLVRGNAVMLHELLGNLLDNAIRYTPTQGKVTLSVLADSDTAQVTVDDTGPGIPESEREMVFERFHRLQENESSGCGLGLAIAREIALLHQATIAIEPGSAGVGTRIRLKMPLTGSSASAAK